MADFDFSELDALSADLGQAPLKAIPLVRKAVEVTANNVKRDWRKFSAEHGVDGTLAQYPQSIDYDMKLDADGEIGAEVGPNVSRPQGTFGIVEDANGGVGGYARRDYEAATKANEKDFIKGIETAGMEALQ